MQLIGVLLGIGFLIYRLVYVRRRRRVPDIVDRMMRAQRPVLS